MVVKKDDYIEISREGAIEYRDKLKNDYLYVEFEVPEGIKYIEISYSFSREKGCIIDIGIIDSKGRFRGWSGSSKKNFFISREKATPGYIEGEIDPGNWIVILGLAKIPENEICKYTVRICMSRKISRDADIRNSTEFRSYIKNNSAKEKNANTSHRLRWIKGDLHTHTIHSDGRNTIHDLIYKAVEKGLEYVAITDHNTTSTSLEIKRLEERGDIIPVKILPGIEITTYYGHMNVWGGEWFDFRLRTREDFISIIREVHRRNLAISINHPVRGIVDCIGCDFLFRDIRGFDALEVWNGPWFAGNSNALEWWHDILCERYRVSAVGGSDYHGNRESPVDLGIPTTYIYADIDSIESIIEAIKEGRTFVTATPSGPVINPIVYYNGNAYTIGDIVKIDSTRKTPLVSDIEVIGASGYTLRLIGSSGVIKAIKIDDHRFNYRGEIIIDPENDPFVRFEIGEYSDPFSLKLKNSDIISVITSPIYIEPNIKNASL